MPIPKRNQNEDKDKFVSRCMSNEVMKKEYPDTKQRVAICLGQTRKKSKGNLFEYVMDILGFSLGCEECEDAEIVTVSNLIIPRDEDYIDFKETPEEYRIDNIIAKK